MAPEVWRRKVSEKSDQYSLAMSYVELRLDRSYSHDMMEIMLDHLERTPDLNPLPEPEQHALKKALSKDPSNRYASCLEFLEALEQAGAPELGKTGAISGTPFAGRGGAGGGGYDTMIQGTGTEGGPDPYSSKTHVGDPTARPAGWRDKSAVGTRPGVALPPPQRRHA